MTTPPRWIWYTLEAAATVVLVAALVGRNWFAFAAMLIVVIAMEIQRRI